MVLSQDMKLLEDTVDNSMRNIITAMDLGLDKRAFGLLVMDI